MLFDVVLPSFLNAIFAGIRHRSGRGWIVYAGIEILEPGGIGFLIISAAA
jgi:ABC-type nitrate/sulfonate/bicarbonate transport system permease component